MHHYTESEMRYARFTAAMRLIERVQSDQPVDSSFLELWARCEVAECDAIAKYKARQLSYGGYLRRCSCGHIDGRHAANGWCYERDEFGRMCSCVQLDIRESA